MLASFPSLTSLIEPAWLFLPHMFLGGAAVRSTPTPVLPDVLQTNFFCRGTNAGTARLLAACKQKGCTVGGFVCAALAFAGAAVEPAAKCHPVGGSVPFEKDDVPLGLSYDINWRSRPV